MRGFDIASDAIAPGSIQVPGSGQPIVLLADRQTTGGYPKIATVISADLPALGRLPIGAKISFTPVTLEAAEAARRALFAEIDGLAEPDRADRRERRRCHPEAVRLQPDRRRGRRPRLGLVAMAAAAQPRSAVAMADSVRAARDDRA